MIVNIECGDEWVSLFEFTGVYMGVGWLGNRKIGDSGSVTTMWRYAQINMGITEIYCEN